MRTLSPKIFSLLLCVALIGTADCALAQDKNAGQPPEDNKEAYLLDAYGQMSADSAGAHADNFAVELQNKPEARGYVICYGPDGEGSGTARYIMRMFQDYLVNMRGIDGSRIQTIYGGRYKNQTEVRNELWIVPPGANPPELKHYKRKLKTFTGKFMEYEGWDGFPDGEYEGPPMGNVTIAAFADLLHQQPKSVAYIVAYNFRKTAPGTWRRVAKIEASDLEGYGIEKERIKIIFGGVIKGKEDENNQQAKVQLWILPEDAPPPVKEAKPEKTPKEAVEIGTYENYLLKYPDKERIVFAGFAEVLGADPRLSLYLIIRPAAPNDSPPIDDSAEPTVLPDESPDIDAAKLVEKWKAELLKSYGVNENRIIVITAAPREYDSGSIDVWVFPPGADLPDPNAQDEPTDNTEIPKEF